MKLLFFTFRDEKQLLSGCPPLYQNKLQEQLVQDVLNRNKIKFEPYGDLVDQAFSQLNENSINNQDPQRQIENDEHPGAGYFNENDSEDTEINKTFAIPNFMRQILPNDEIAKSINSLNSKQRELSLKICDILPRISCQLVIISVLPLSVALPAYYRAITVNFYYK